MLSLQQFSKSISQHFTPISNLHVANRDTLNSLVEVYVKVGILLTQYDLLANELSMIHKCKVDIIPFVITWDGVVTTYHKKYRKLLKVTNRIEAYIQSKILHKTLESVSLDYKRSSEYRTPEGEDMTEFIQRLVAAPIEEPQKPLTQVKSQQEH